MSKVAWTPEEDLKLIEYIETYGACNWKSLSQVMRINRDGKSCRERWVNHLNPTIKKGAFSEEEIQLVLKYHDELGNKWSSIAAKIPGRSDNDIKNCWNGMQRRKYQEALILHHETTQEAKQEPNALVPSSFSSMASISNPSNNPCRPSPTGLFDTLESQPISPVPTYANQHSGLFQSNNKDNFLNYALRDSVPLPCIWMNSHPKMEECWIQSVPVFTSAQTTVSTIDWRRTSNDTTTSTTDNKEKYRSVQKEGIKTILGDEVMSLIGSSSSNGQLPQWSDLGH